MKKLLVLSIVLITIVSSDAWTEAKHQKIKLELDCRPTMVVRTINVPEGKKASNFRLIKYDRGTGCPWPKVEDNPDTDADEAKIDEEKWKNREPILYGWGIKGKTGYYYALRLLRGFRDKEVGNYGSLWLAPGDYTVVLEGERQHSSLELEYLLEPYTPDEKKTAAAPVPTTTPAATGTVEKPHAPGETPATETISAGGKWGGKWHTHPGEIVLTQNGNHVTGYYTLQNGKVTGTVSGNTLIVKWSDGPTYKPPIDAGEAIYKMAADGKSFSVDFRGGYAKDNLPWFKNAWKATRAP